MSKVLENNKTEDEIARTKTFSMERSQIKWF
jgi:hypothetical protein